MTERDKKKAAKAAEREKKKAAEREKEALLQKKLIEVFNDKQAKASKEADPINKLKQWLKNPPYKSTEKNMKVNPNLLTRVERNPLLSDAVSAAAEE